MTPSQRLPLTPGQTIGIVGGGQLGRMLALAAYRLGFRVRIFAQEDKEPAAQITPYRNFGSFEDRDALLRFAGDCDLITFEFENLPVSSLEALAQIAPLEPNLESLAVAQDRAREKETLKAISIPVAPFALVDDEASLARALDEIGTPAILKTRRFGYDGKGQARVDRPDEGRGAFDRIARAPAILEKRIAFTSEFSVILARASDGSVEAFPIARNEHRNHILHQSHVPAGYPDALLASAQDAAKRLAETLDYRGVLTLEMFETPGANDAGWLANEIAPRVHNSGHWTLDACTVSQFEQHIRAIAGWPLRPAQLLAPATMTNLLGPAGQDFRVLSNPSHATHAYGKAEAREDRKMGHITRLEGEDGA